MPESTAEISRRQQTAAIQHVGAPARLLAGPGTGKTWALTQRVISLVKDHEVPPGKILILTFTRAAAQEVKGRLADELGEHGALPRVSTLHAYALRQLLRNGDLFPALPKPLRIADDWEERNIVQEDLRDLLNAVDPSRLTVRDVRDLLTALSSDWDTLRADEEGWETGYPNPEFLSAWKLHRAIYGYTLRSELVYQLKRALFQSGNFELDDIPEHLLIDEYQDLNPCDLAVADWLRGQGAELFAAGDDDQSIYGFRNAYPVGIRRFVDEVEAAEDLRLEICRRCDTEILKLADFVIRLDRNRVIKILRAEDERGPGEVKLSRFSNQFGEANAIAAKCQALVQEGLSPSEILILLRQDRFGKFSGLLARAMSDRGVPNHFETNEATAFDTKGGRQLLALLRLAFTEDDSLAWRTILKLDRNNLGDAAIERIFLTAMERRITFGAVLQVNESELCLGDLAQRVKDYTLSVRKDCTELRDSLSTDTYEPEEKNSHLRKALSNFVRPARITSQDDFARAVDRLQLDAETGEAWDLESLMQESGLTRKEDEPVIDPGAVNILTMHKAKGLGADTVFIACAEDEFIPGRAATGPEEDDERRLFYVSITRAKRRLFITYCDRRMGDQLHAGANSGVSTHTLTRFLSDGPLKPMPLT